MKELFEQIQRAINWGQSWEFLIDPGSFSITITLPRERGVPAVREDFNLDIEGTAKAVKFIQDNFKEY